MGRICAWCQQCLALHDAKTYGWCTGCRAEIRLENPHLSVPFLCHHEHEEASR